VVDGQSRFYVEEGIVPTNHHTIAMVEFEALTVLLFENSSICQEVYGELTAHSVA
jgi:hypothetical protein